MGWFLPCKSWALCRRRGLTASEATRNFVPLPQTLRNLRFEGTDPLDKPKVQEAIAEAQTALGNKGRVVVRKSGTEPLICLMVEAESHTLVEQTLDKLESAVQNQ